MGKIRADQYNTKLMEIHFYDDNIETLINFIEKNLPVLQKFILNIHTDIDEDRLIRNINKYEKDLIYIINKKIPSKTITNIKEPEKTLINTNISKNADNEKPIKFIDKIIRGGEELILSEPAVIIGNINLDGIVKTTDNLIVLGKINGTVICDGEILIIKNVSDKAIVLFNGTKITVESKECNLIKLKKQDEKITVEYI